MSRLDGKEDMMRLVHGSVFSCSAGWMTRSTSFDRCSRTRFGNKVCEWELPLGLGVISAISATGFESELLGVAPELGVHSFTHSLVDDLAISANRFHTGSER